MNKKKLPTLIAIAVIAVIAVIIFGSATFIVIQPGERGILFRPWGSGLDKENIYIEGVHVIAPWNEMNIYDVKEQSIEFSAENPLYTTLDVLDKNGLTIEVEVTIRFYPSYEMIGYIHEKFGTTYVEKLVIPEVRSAVRKIMGKYKAEEIYSTLRQEVEEAIILETETNLATNDIIMTALLVRSIIIPADIKTAIENKLTKEQESLSKQYDLDIAQQNYKIDSIDAEAIANYNRIINASLTDKILKQKGIDATIDLSTSANAKIIVIGNSEDGLPLILGQ
jgi:regulator of protease activity HflC (stomatin/prohibitin superfamily)